MKITFAKICWGLLLVLVLFLIRPVGFILYAYLKDKDAQTTVKTGLAQDASRLNETRVDTVVKVLPGIAAATRQISQLIKQAKAEGKKISIAGAQHSMGGHTIYPDGIILDMKTFHGMELDSSKRILKVGAGALWSEVIPYLDRYGKSVSVMQSNNSFSVGGSISVNCHGWQCDAPPISSTVVSFHLMNAEGEVLNCSRTENEALFSLVLGGYGLFGVILDVNLKVVDNKNYVVQHYEIRSEDYLREFQKLVKHQGNVGMAYGRINVNPDHFMEEAILSTYTVDSEQPEKLVNSTNYSFLRRAVFRGSANSAYGKNLRWKMEKMSGSLIDGKKFSRNRLQNEGVEVFQNTDPDYTDILHEYFIPGESVAMFIKALKGIIPNSKVDLLNVTLRNVRKDEDTYLPYANGEVFGFVMLFNQKKGAQAEKEMKELTGKLIDIAISLKGTYYLPYRLHASKEQLDQAYPAAKSFFLLKKKYDPDLLFRNQFYEVYGR
ncbi:FAD/FMN-containing dehydrogenase [Pedobacter steynii]|uniref:FAD/FMN-containing dehydrogenase n=1 Tax=Pedobacter steynii TaxID=430522 RepID=A0A1H0K1U3_9SPHI|nr:FAD-binding oxidoreductase [Pedobacter steynii]NQX43224.1 FAD-binding oxidoreductase [Pedobacter steynii]SDO49854.1 FAD/FMN-containing dehydrogenase [Pedobacter steynii]